MPVPLLLARLISLRLLALLLGGALLLAGVVMSGAPIADPFVDVVVDPALEVGSGIVDDVLDWLASQLGERSVPW